MANKWSPACEPASRDKPGWLKTHFKLAKATYASICNTILIGDSIVSGLGRYQSVWDQFFPNAVNLGVGGDLTQHVLWRVRNTRFNRNIKFIVVHCGTNNLNHHQPCDISNALILISEKIQLYNPTIKVILSGILPRGTGNFYNDKISKQIIF